MGQKVTLGGERLGAGNNQKIELRNYERSSHDLSYVWRSTMASGTLVPFMNEIALPGDTFDINLNCVIKTLPTLGPLFGSYKVQLDVFQIPIRLYQAQLHMNQLGIGMDMSKIKLPQMRMRGTTPPQWANIDNYQINASSIFSYLDIRGIGYLTNNVEQAYQKMVLRDFNAIGYLAYFDIYKNYYSNKQEEKGVIIHNELLSNDLEVDTVVLTTRENNYTLTKSLIPQETDNIKWRSDTILEIFYDSLTTFNAEQWVMSFSNALGTQNVKLVDLFSIWINDTDNNKIRFSAPYNTYFDIGIGTYWYEENAEAGNDSIPNLVPFELKDIDEMRKYLLTQVNNSTPVIIQDSEIEVYKLPFYQIGVEDDFGTAIYSKNSAQEGLLIKTYQSDLFNNWISTEWIDGDNGVNAITSVNTEEGFFTIDSLNLSKKIYDMLNRIAVSGGTYDDWLDATYTHERMKSAENPIYCGGLSKELVFEEIFSQSTTQGQPLGTLAGKGSMTNKHKGGEIKIRIDEPSYIMGIVSLTPRIDYSQGNKWSVNLQTMNDFHKPALDEIGFQDLITDQMAWWDTGNKGAPIGYPSDPEFKSAGKQPAWINYMTNVNKVYGDFANINKEQYMVLNRRYDVEKKGWNDISGSAKLGIQDLTTYIDPSKFNFIFADTRLSAMNFWAQIKVDIYARRKMSAKVIPNL